MGVAATAASIMSLHGSWSPGWVNPNGAYMTWDGAAIGADSTAFTMVFYVRNWPGNNAATNNIFNNHGTRLQIRTNSADNYLVTIQDTTATPVTLIDWTSTAAIGADAGDWLVHTELNSSGSPAFAVNRAEVVGGVAGAWGSVAGTAASGPTAGTIDFARAFSGNDYSIWASLTGTNIAEATLGYLWISNSTSPGTAAFAAGGRVINPAQAGTPVILITGPAATWGTDHGSSGTTWTVTGTPLDA